MQWILSAGIPSPQLRASFGQLRSRWVCPALLRSRIQQEKTARQQQAWRRRRKGVLVGRLYMIGMSASRWGERGLAGDEFNWFMGRL